MSDIKGVNQSLLDKYGIPEQTTKTNEDLGQDEFFELMVAQLQNQNPLEPQTNGEFLSQLAQFRTSDGISEMQASLDALTTSMQSSQALQASTLVGKSVMVPSSTASLGSEGGVEGMFSLSSSANDVVLEVTDDTGELIKRVPLGRQVAGDIPFSWDGTDQQNQRVAEGSYQISVTGQIGENTLQIPTYVTANVNSVSFANDGQGLKLNVDGVGQTSIDDVKQISE